jgi:uncharacterized protein
MNIYQLQGYMRAVASGPGTAEISAWKPLVFNDELPLYDANYTEDSISNALISLYNFVEAQISEEACTLPFICAYQADRSLRLDSEQWARGFMQGYIFWQDVWSQVFNAIELKLVGTQTLSAVICDEIDDTLVVISAIADADYALHSGTQIDDIKQMYERLPKVVVDYSRHACLVRNVI